MWKHILAVIGVLLMVGSPANAAFRVILCDTPDQIAQVFTMHANGTTFDEAIEATNLQAGSPNACSKVTMEATLLGSVRDVTLRGNTYTIVKVVVTAVSDGEHMLPVPFLKQFGVMPVFGPDLAPGTGYTGFFLQGCVETAGSVPPFILRYFTALYNQSELRTRV